MNSIWYGRRYELAEAELQRMGLEKPFFISEFNVPFGVSYGLTETAAAGQAIDWHETISAYFGERFLGAAWFIWDDQTADDHWSFPGFAIGPHTSEFLRLIADYNHIEETPMPAYDNWDQERADWKAAGGDEDLNFQLFLAATGRIAVTEEWLAKAKENAKARMEEIELLSRKLGPKAP